jgi:hypothetical protein
MSERLGVHGVVLDAGRGDGLRPQRMGHVRGDPGVGEQIGEPAPAVGGLEGDLQGLWAELPEDPQELPGIVVDPTVREELASGIERHHVRTLAVKVDSDVNHDWASFLSLARADSTSALSTGAGGPLLHGIKWLTLIIAILAPHAI